MGLIHDELSDEVKEGMAEILNTKKQEYIVDKVNPNLILSEIFQPSNRYLPAI